jgi:peroxiredoxin
VREIPTLRTLHEDLGPRGLTIVGVNQDLGSGSELGRYAQRQAIPYRLVLDGEGEAARKYGLETLPSLAVVDREGRVRGKASGETSGRELREALEPYLVD